MMENVINGHKFTNVIMGMNVTVIVDFSFPRAEWLSSIHPKWLLKNPQKTQQELVAQFGMFFFNLILTQQVNKYAHRMGTFWLDDWLLCRGVV